MLLTPEIAMILIAIKILLSMVTGMAAAFLLHAWRPVGKHWLLAGTAIGIGGFMAGSFLTGWASVRTEYWNGRPATWRTWFASQEFTFPLILAVCFVGTWHLWLMTRRRR